MTYPNTSDNTLFLQLTFPMMYLILNCYLTHNLVHVDVPAQFCVVDQFYTWFNLYFPNLSWAMMFEKEENTI